MEEENKKVIAVDFDGVLHEFKEGWTREIPEGKPVKDSLWAIKELTNKGFSIVVYTSRANLEAVSLWLRQNGFPALEVTNHKPIAIAYIDDRGIRFENNWESIVKYFI